MRFKVTATVMISANRDTCGGCKFILWRDWCRLFRCRLKQTPRKALIRCEKCRANSQEVKK